MIEFGAYIESQYMAPNALHVFSKLWSAVKLNVCKCEG